MKQNTNTNNKQDSNQNNNQNTNKNNKQIDNYEVQTKSTVMNLEKLKSSPKHLIISPLFFKNSDGSPATIFAKT